MTDWKLWNLVWLVCGVLYGAVFSIIFLLLLLIPRCGKKKRLRTGDKLKRLMHICGCVGSLCFIFAWAGDAAEGAHLLTPTLLSRAVTKTSADMLSTIFSLCYLLIVYTFVYALFGCEARKVPLWVNMSLISVAAVNGMFLLGTEAASLILNRLWPSGIFLGWLMLSMWIGNVTMASAVRALHKFINTSQSWERNRSVFRNFFVFMVVSLVLTSALTFFWLQEAHLRLKDMNRTLTYPYATVNAAEIAFCGAQAFGLLAMTWWSWLPLCTRSNFPWHKARDDLNSEDISCQPNMTQRHTATRPRARTDILPPLPTGKVGLGDPLLSQQSAGDSIDSRRSC